MNHSASREQVKALQALYARWEAHSAPSSMDARAARLAWASEATGRPVSSFSELSRDEARMLIDTLKGSLGQAVNQTANPWRRIKSRDRAEAAGTSGRRDSESAVIQMASPDDLARVDELVHRLNWTPEQLAAWLKSPRSPLGAGSDATIRTVRQANRVYWALKAMLTRAGGWRTGSGRKPARSPKASRPDGVHASQA